MIVDRSLVPPAPHPLERRTRDLRLRNMPHLRPLHAQLGGSDATLLSAAARICYDGGFEGININAGWCVSLFYIFYLRFCDMRLIR